MANSPASKDPKADENWWPAPLAHLRDLDPWADNNVVVAEISSFNDGPHTGHRLSFSTLVPIADLDKLKKNLATLEHEVHTSGPHPWASPDRPYTPKFWMETEGSPRHTYEPL